MPRHAAFQEVFTRLKELLLPYAARLRVAADKPTNYCLEAPASVRLRNVDLALELEALAFYLGRVFSAQGGDLPEDRLDSDIDDGDPEMGFYSPWSWWPVILAGSASLMLLGFAVGTWITFIGVALVLVAIVGWVYEYYRGYFAR